MPPGRTAAVAAALVEAVGPLGERGVPVELSLTGGKDSRLIAAALTAAEVPFRARTHGFASHPDVIVAAMIASRLGIEHVVTEPRPAAPEQAPGRGGRAGQAPLGGAGLRRHAVGVRERRPARPAGDRRAGADRRARR